MGSYPVQATFDRLAQLPGVLAAILIDGKGLPVRSTLNDTDTMRYANKMQPLVTMARSMVQEMEPTDQLTYVRLRTRKQEVMVATENQHTIIIIQDNKVLDESRRNSIAQQQRASMSKK
ncbi:uncharacterized protein LOC110183783 [Drosophila serrata]|uniref:uncharacterized protein LOC110183783 n=1 Tax=Drosophila serrata TaxID=7274 RepID=UPI000A1D0431|nr:uncharacterized protein LOC110183783 [Drosophila serrata]